jgi:polyisoprenyl-phosphate glycosyltransferase
MKKTITVIVPCYNEELVIEQTHSRLLALRKGSAYAWKILYVNDGSRDGTTRLLDSFGTASADVGAIHLARNFGHQSAVCAGLQAADSDYIAIIDADLQDPPEAIEPMVDALVGHGVEIVYGQRERRQGESLFKKATSVLFYRLLNALSDVKFPVDVGDFRVISRRAADCFNSLPEGSKYIRGLMSWTGLLAEPYLYVRDPRAAGETKYTLKKMLKLASDGILSFSTKPLKIMTSLGFFCVLVALGIGLWALIQKIIGAKVAVGWASLVMATVFLGGVQLLSLGVMGEYVGRIFEEVKKRPDYIIGRISGNAASGLPGEALPLKSKEPSRRARGNKNR